MPEEPPENSGDPDEEASFENALPAPERPLRDVESVSDDEPTSDRPSLDELMARVPASTRDALEQLFRLKFVGVRKIRPENLR